MNKILTLKGLMNRSKKTKTVLVGGCFDILHIGHIRFLQEAKKRTHKLIVILESDKKVNILKGRRRPFFSQKERAQVLAALQFVDIVFPLPFMNSDQAYLDLIMKIKPDIIAVTINDPLLEKKKMQANIIGGKLEIIPHIPARSTSRLARFLGID